MSDVAGGVRHVAIVTGANHGIGAATATALARAGCAVLCTFLRIVDPVDPGIPAEYRANRAASCDALVAEIAGAGGLAEAVEADLTALISGNVITLR
jgi:3-oxoacyl-[acyl-carrier protein] reductase